MKIPDAAVEAAAQYIGAMIWGQDEPDAQDRIWAREILERAAPHMAAAGQEAVTP